MIRKAHVSRYFGMTKPQRIVLIILSFSLFCLISIFILLLARNNELIQLSIPTSSSTPPSIIANISLSINQTSDKRVVINGNTNLPNDTIIMISVNGAMSGYSAQDRVVVLDGKFSAGPFSSAGSGLDGGKYIVEALMPYPAVQPESVRKIIGSNGEKLAGEQVVYDKGVLVIVKKEFSVVVPTPSPLPLPTATATPVKIMITGGDIGRGWYNDEHRVSLLSVYRTESLDGTRPFGERNGGYRGGFTQFLVVELQFDRYSSGYDEYQLSKFWLWSLSDKNDVEYQAESYLYQSQNIIQVYYQEKVHAVIAFEIQPDSHNFIMCYWTGIAMDMSGKMVNECGPSGYQYKFGD